MADSTLKVNIVAVDKASKQLDTIGGKMGGMAKVAVVAGAAVAVSFGTQSVRAFAEAEKAQVQLQAAYEKFPQLADGNIEALKALNTELANKTRFDDDAFATAQASLAQYGLTQDQLEKLSPLVADYAAKTGTDLATAAQQVGKAMLGQGRALKGVGIDFKDAGSVGANFEQIMGGLSEKVGGFAEKDAQTAAGKTEMLKNKFGEIQETVGGALMPALSKLADVLLKVVGFIERNATVIVPAAAGVAALAAAVWLSNAAFAAQATIMAAGGLAAYLKSLPIVRAATAAWAGVQWLLNAALTANPIGLIVVAIAALVAAIVIAYKKSETFRNIVDGALRAVGGAFNWLKEKAVAAFNWIKTNWDTIVAVLKNTPIGIYLRVVWASFKWLRDKIGGAVKWILEKWNGVTNFFKTFGATLSRFTGGIIDALVWPFKFAFNLISKAWNATVGGLSFSIPDWVKFSGNPIAIALAGKSFSIPNAPEVAMAVGGKVNADGLAMLHKGEVVMPYERAMGIERGGVTVVVNVNGSALASKQEIARAVTDALRSTGARGLALA